MRTISAGNTLLDASSARCIVSPGSKLASAATETIAGLTHRIAALRDIVTVDYPAGNRTAVPMVNFKASSEAKDGGAPAASGSGDATVGGADGGKGRSGGTDPAGGVKPGPDEPSQRPKIG